MEWPLHVLWHFRSLMSSFMVTLCIIAIPYCCRNALPRTVELLFSVNWHSLSFLICITRNFQHGHHHHHHHVPWLQVPERSKWGPVSWPASAPFTSTFPEKHSCIRWNFSLVSGGKKKCHYRENLHRPRMWCDLFPLEEKSLPDWPLRCNLFSRLKKWKHALICFITLPPFEY